MPNAAGRLAGAVLSGVLHQWQGLEACLWASAGLLLAAGALSLLLPLTAGTPGRGEGPRRRLSRCGSPATSARSTTNAHDPSGLGLRDTPPCIPATTARIWLYSVPGQTPVVPDRRS